MKIKHLTLKGKTFLAPLAGITNLPFRRLVKQCGCSVVCSEMISAKGVWYQSEKTLKLLTSHAQERPLSMQIFGNDPQSMAFCAEYIARHCMADIIDINFGCSVKKVVKQGAGVALMREPELTRSILMAVRNAVDLPFTIKIRSGWDASGSQAFQIARIAQDCGVDAIAMHPRTATQAFKGTADWDLIGRLKAKISIPVIGNGDINSVEDAVKMIQQTGCDGIMAGRAVMRNPFLLSQIDDYLEKGSYSTNSHDDLFRAMEILTCEYVDYFFEIPACKMLRSRLPWFVKAMPGCVAFRKKMTAVTSKKEILSLIDAYRSTLNAGTTL